MGGCESKNMVNELSEEVNQGDGSVNILPDNADLDEVLNGVRLAIESNRVSICPADPKNNGNSPCVTFMKTKYEYDVFMKFVEARNIMCFGYISKRVNILNIDDFGIFSLHLQTILGVYKNIEELKPVVDRISLLFEIALGCVNGNRENDNFIYDERFKASMDLMRALLSKMIEYK